MIEAIEKIPEVILKGQSELSKFNDKQKFLVIFLDEKFNIKKMDKGNFSEICERNHLTEFQKEFIKKFRYYLGAEQFGNTKYGRKGFGGQFGLFTCSLLHYNFAKDTFNSIIDNRDTKKAENSKKAINDSEKEEVQILKKYPNIKDKLNQIIDSFFLNILKNKKEREYNIVFEGKNEKIVFMPNDDTFIDEYNQFYKEYLNLKSGRNNDSKNFRFDIDTSERYDSQLHQLYSKFGQQKIVIQDETCNVIPKDTANKIDSFKKYLKKGVIPLPLFYVPKDRNIYTICFSDNSLLKKLKDIYSELDNKPFNYLLVSNFDGYRFERVIHFNFDINNLINKEIYLLRFNQLKQKKEILSINNRQQDHDKFELLFDISNLFWNIRDKTKVKEMSFFNPKIKNNQFLNQLLLENSESIVSQIFKENNTFIRYRLFKLVNNILKGTFKVQDLKKRYSSTEQARRLLLTYYKYGEEKNMTSKIKEIEEKLDEFVKSNTLKTIENDEMGLYLAGQIVNYLLSKTSYGGSKLDLMTKYLLSVNSTEQLKKKVCELTARYSHNIYDNEKWRIANKRFLEYDFTVSNFKQNLIPFFTGFYADNIFFTKKEEETKNNDLMEVEQNE